MTIKNIEKWYDKRISSSKRWRPLHYYNYFIKILSFYLSFKNKKILDCGCGTGELMKLLYPLSEEIVGCDISKKSIEVANELLNNKCKILHTDMTNLNLETNYFDIIIALGSMEHCLDISLALKELYRVGNERAIYDNCS